MSTNSDNDSQPERPRVATEAIAGVTTFFTMAYIVVVNPAILASDGTGMPFSGVVTATVLVCFAMTLLMGLYAKLPFAVAPGMGINAFFAYTIVIGQGVPWPVALGAVFWAGVLFLLVSLTPLRETIARAIPLNLRIATAGGIGVFIAFIGLQKAGLVVSNPVTFVQLGGLGIEALLTVTGVAIAAVLLRRRSPFAFLAAITAVTLLGLGLGLVALPPSLVSRPDFSSAFLRLDPLGALHLALLPAIVSILFTDLFDSISTFIGVSHASGLLDENGDPKNLRQGLVVDAVATFGAGLAGSSPGTAYIESIAGINAGGRTGLTSVFTALCFLPCFFLAPLAGMVPGFATAPVLLLVGAAMFRSVTKLEWDAIEDALPAFLAVVLIPLTFSITQGILWGFVAHVGMYCLVGRRREIHPMMYALAAVAVGLLLLEHGRFSGAGAAPTP
jgi:AGZA family xanthine/uracil permease-like MFS transporter